MDWEVLTRDYVLNLLEPYSGEELDEKIEELIEETESILPDVLWKKWFEIFDSLSDIPRAWWVRPQVWVPVHIAESVMEHSLNMKRACTCVVKWTPEKVENHERFPKLWKRHDILEYHKVLLDITPHCWYTDEQKALLERYVFLLLCKILKEDWVEVLSIIKEYMEQTSPNSKLCHLLDKLDAWIKAFEYEKLWYNVAEFFPYALEKVKWDKYLTIVYEVLLEREFTELDYQF